MGLLAVVGHTTRDLVGSRRARAGGAPLYAGRALQLLGEPAVLVTRCAEADQWLLGALRATGLSVVWRASASTPTFSIREREGERELELDALGEPWTLADARGWVGEALAGADWVHAGALWRGEFPLETLVELRRGRRVSLDAQGLVRPKRTGPVRLDREFAPETLEAIDLLHLSEPEAAALGLSLDERSLRSLGVPEVLVTVGARGAIVFADGLAEHVPARMLDRVDTTGAGDAFTAAYVACRRRGHVPTSAARVATEVVHELLAGGACR